MSNTDIFLARQPILDRNQGIVAYELLFRSGNTAAASITNELNATAHVIVSLFNEMGLQSVLGKERGFINVNADMLLSDMIHLLPSKQIVIELLETIVITPEILAQCHRLKQGGFTLALDDFAGMQSQYRDLLPIIDIIKVDLMQIEPERLPDTVRRLRAYPAQLLAEKVETREVFERCAQLGFQYFQGYYFAKPLVLSSKRATPSALALLKLLSLILDDAATAALEAAVKSDSNLTYNLLRLVNSVGAGTGHKIDTLAKAILVVGRRQLQRWLQLLLYSIDGPPERSSPLMQLAATRAKALEIICRFLNNQDAALQERAFITGAFSLLDTLLSLPMADVVAQLKLHEDVVLALTQRQGLLGTLLRLLEALERGDFEAAQELRTGIPGLETQILNEAQMAAIRWVNSLNEAA